MDFAPAEIETVRRGLWKVVNEDGGTGGKARLQGVQVAGKTGTAQAFTNGKKDTIAWFCCFAPYDHPKYVVAVMVQGGEHGGGVAAPIATRILQRTLAMDEGNFNMQVAWLAPAHKQNPFQMIPAVDFKDSGPNVGNNDDEKSDDSQATDSQLAAGGGDPDVEQDPDAAGQVSKARVRRAQPIAQPVQQARQNFWQRLFGQRPAPQQQPAPVRRPTPRTR
jgi:penicillin-binding protein 2